MEQLNLLHKIYHVSLFLTYILIEKYYPRGVDFTKNFLGGNFHDTGLNTNKTPSRVHNNYD